MPQIELRIQSGSRSPDDLLLTIQDKTYDFLMSSPASEVRVSSFLDRDWPKVAAMYEEIFVHERCPFRAKVTKIIPGSRERKNISLPGPMEEGEQLTILVTRTRTVEAAAASPSESPSEDPT